MSIKDRLYHAWNALNGNAVDSFQVTYGGSSRSQIHTTGFLSSKSYAGMIFNRIAIDVAMVDINHVIVDPETLNETPQTSGIQECLQVQANIDQSNRDFMRDIVFSMFDEGSIAVVPVETTLNPKVTGGYDIKSMRVGKITQWFPKHVRVKLYDERDAKQKEVDLPKDMVAIIENPMYAITNGDNSTLRRLISKMKLLDMQDQLEASGKLDMIIQLPYVIKTPLKRREAEKRLSDLEAQLMKSKYGVAYTDGAEKITQINRPITNNLQQQVDSLKLELYNQLGLTETIFNGKASEAEMRLYYSRTIDPIITTILAEFKRKFLTKTARTQGHTFTFRRDMFKLVPAEQMATLADTLTRNAILSPNEVRNILGYGPNAQPESDQLINRNVSNKNQATTGSVTSPDNGQNGYNQPMEGEET